MDVSMNTFQLGDLCCSGVQQLNLTLQLLLKPDFIAAHLP